MVVISDICLLRDASLCGRASHSGNFYLHPTSLAQFLEYCKKGRQIQGLTWFMFPFGKQTLNIQINCPDDAECSCDNCRASQGDPSGLLAHRTCTAFVIWLPLASFSRDVSPMYQQLDIVVSTECGGVGRASIARKRRPAASIPGASHRTSIYF